MRSHPITTNPDLSPIKRRAALALALGKGVTVVADEVGRHRTTIWAWLNTDPQFQQEVSRCVAEIRKTALEQLPELAKDSLQLLTAVLRDPYAKRRDQLHTAELVLTRLLRLHEVVSASDYACPDVDLVESQLVSADADATHAATLEPLPLVAEEY